MKEEMRVVTLRKVCTDDGEREFEFIKRQEADSNGYMLMSSLKNATTFEDFKKGLEEVARKEELDLAKLRDEGRVPQVCWWIENEAGEIIGTAKTRFLLTGALLRLGGHIGIGLDKRYRGQGYGAQAMGLLIDKMVERGVLDVLITAYDWNKASRAMIEKNGGELWDAIEDEHGKHVRYWVRRTP